MIRIGGYYVKCSTEDYNGAWRAIVDFSHVRKHANESPVAARYSVPVILTTPTAAELAALAWARRLVETSWESIDLAIEGVQLDSAAAVDDPQQHAQIPLPL